jgi:hypothetical protein
MLLVQEYLMTHSFGDLAREHGVYASFSKSGHKFSVNYDQIEARESDPLSQECRGLILSLMDGQPIMGLTGANGKINRDHIVMGPTKVLAYPMARFFNYGQGSAANINWHDPKLAVLEKLDGTLCIVYWDPWKSQWCVASRSVPEADLLMDNGIFTFRTLFEKALEETTRGLPFEQFTSYLDKNITYCFELTTPYNRIVVNYQECRITLIAARNILSGKEIDPSKIKIDVIPIVQSHTHTTVSELLDWVSSLNPMDHEGVVVRDSNFNRIKVKNAAYVAFNKCRDTLSASERNCVELILAEKDDDVIPFLPEEIVKNIQKIKVGIHQGFKDHDFAYRGIVSDLKSHNLSDKKSFALMVSDLVKAHPGIWSAPFFQMYDGKVSNMKDFVMKNRKDGTWPSGFLDKILALAKHVW